MKLPCKLPMLTEDDAYEMGLDCAFHGASPTNCHFGLFATPELTKAWELGKAVGDKEKAHV